jgi:hypothetical protein
MMNECTIVNTSMEDFRDIARLGRDECENKGDLIEGEKVEYFKELVYMRDVKAGKRREDGAANHDQPSNLPSLLSDPAPFPSTTPHYPSQKKKCTFPTCAKIYSKRDVVYPH